jgi:3-oxoadipyl-CoA thiolase
MRGRKRSHQLTCREAAPKTRYQFGYSTCESAAFGRKSMGDVFVCDAVRTPIGRFGGSLAKVRTDDLAATPIKALVARRPDLDWSEVDEVFFGCANQAGEDNRNVARMALLLAGLPETVPGQTLNRLCASGLDAVGAAGRAIRAGEIDLAIAGGVES